MLAALTDLPDTRDRFRLKVRLPMGRNWLKEADGNQMNVLPSCAGYNTGLRPWEGGS